MATSFKLTVLGILLVAGIGFPLRAEEITVFTGATLIDGSGRPPVADATLVIKDDRIAAVGKVDAAAFHGRIVDCRGKTIIPGLISDHSHVGLVKDGKVSPDHYTAENIQAALLQYEGYGVTAILALGLNKDLLYGLRDQQRSGNLSGADIFTADRGIGVPAAAPPVAVGLDQLARPQTPEEARQIVDQMAAQHPDMIKLWVDDFFGTVQPKMLPEIQAAIIDEAHQKGLRVAAHVFYLEDAKRLLRQGLDVIAHSIRDQPVDQEFITIMKANHSAYIPTLQLDESQFVFAEHPSWMESAAFRAAADPKLLQTWLSPYYAAKMSANPQTPKNKAALATALQNAKTLHDAGVLIGFGTDSGATPTRLPGWAEHRELQLLVEAGLTPLEALTSATGNAAEVIGDAKNRGILEPGKRADFLILEADPLKDIRNTTRLFAIYHGGRHLDPAFQEVSSMPTGVPSSR
jgi:imidazolonepropionase-like amidohydrolase